MYFLRHFYESVKCSASEHIKFRNKKFEEEVLDSFAFLLLVTQAGYWNGLLLRKLGSFSPWRHIIIIDLILNETLTLAVKILTAGYLLIQ